MNYLQWWYKTYSCDRLKQTPCSTSYDWFTVGLSLQYLCGIFTIATIAPCYTTVFSNGRSALVLWCCWLPVRGEREFPACYGRSWIWSVSCLDYPKVSNCYTVVLWLPMLPIWLTRGPGGDLEPFAILHSNHQYYCMWWLLVSLVNIRIIGDSEAVTHGRNTTIRKGLYDIK